MGTHRISQMVPRRTPPPLLLLTFVPTLLGLSVPPPAPGRLILLRHGQSVWNLENRFTGWEDVPLTDTGIQEALTALETLLESEGPPIEIDMCYSSVLQRTIRTANVFLDGYVAARGCRRPPLRQRWRLNERHYGLLQGLNKRDAMRELDAKKLNKWRSTFAGKPPPMEPDHPFFTRDGWRLEALLEASCTDDDDLCDPLRVEDVPLTESLADCRDRVRPLWENELQPAVMAGASILVVGHANGLRSLVSCIQPGTIRDADLATLGLPNAIPVVYEFERDGRVRRGVEGRCYVPPIEGYYLGDACHVFNALDTDGSGALNAAELAESEACYISFSSMDRDGDGVVDAAELRRACGEWLLDEADGNGDGVVNFNEYMTWWQKKKKGL